MSIYRGKEYSDCMQVVQRFNSEQANIIIKEVANEELGKV